MKKVKQTIEWGLISRKLNNKLTEQEERQFERWLSASEKNRQYFRQAQAYHQKQVEDLDLDLVPDTTVGFMQKLNHRNKVRTLYRNFRVAAAIVLPLMLVGGTYWYYQNSKTNDEQLAEQTPIATIRTKATLITTNGAELDLSASGVDLTDSIAGIHIVNDSLQGLSYPKEAETTLTAFNTLITPRGGEYKLTLADGTQVWLNCESELHYPVAFNGDVRKVSLKGEAFFDVTKSTKPFIVETEDVNVRVLGTRFNVSAYRDEDAVKTTLTRGLVNVESKLVNGSLVEVSLKPGDQAEYLRSDAQLLRQTVDTTLYVGWIDGYFRFEGQTLDQVMRNLSRWYDVDYHISAGVDRQKRLFGKLNRQDDFDIIMGMVSKIAGTSFERDGNQVKVSPKK
ncbi:FecR family protein [Mangrovibacterium diazotrophicum]|nr:FecR family protein [Mangrovibacterium diazotrophicum]